jgi:uncharacterized protein YceK
MKKILLFISVYLTLLFISGCSPVLMAIIGVKNPDKTEKLTKNDIVNFSNKMKIPSANSLLLMKII